MLDPLTAISLASSIVQFTDFGIKLVTGTIELYHSADGLSEERSNLEHQTTLVRKYAEAVMLSAEYHGDDDPESENEEELRELAASCKEIASHLLSVLDDLKVKQPAGRGRKWESFRKIVAALTPHNKNKIEALEKWLHSVKDAMLNRIQFIMSEKQSQVLMTLKDLADEKLLQMKNDVLKTTKSARKEVKAAVQILVTQLSCLAEASRDQKILCILNSLDFETRQTRQSDISGTEHRTFEWIFQDHHGPSDQRVGFREWLQFGNDIYWISGKAGSGKSVLMNYIAHDPFTHNILQSWAGTARLIIAKHFFWNAGAPMQKSQQGLLQSLLREVCGQCPELVPIVCAFRWKRYHQIGGTWTRLELSEAFKKLSEQRLISLKFCFFVDGVDEYEGEDHTHIINVLKSLNASPSVKICLSSRPWNIFAKAFGSELHQRLLLEDHNEYDIQQYVKNKFQEDEQFTILQSREPRSSDLVDQIVQNAQGVFLWVRIVVNNLLRGLSNDDNLSDLQKRLQSLPTTLAAYYQHMFDNIDDFYREETSEILLICLEGIQPLSLLTFWFYEQERVAPGYTLRADRAPFARADVVAVFQKIHKRLNARGQDLLVIEADTTAVVDLMYTVRFSHLTVKNFLSEPGMLKKLHSWTSKNFDARISLCKSTLAIVKTINTPPLTYMKDPPIGMNRYDHVSAICARNDAVISNRCWNYVSDFFSYAHLIGHQGGTIDDSLIDEFRSVISSILVRKAHRRGPFTYLNWAIDQWACWINQYNTMPLQYDQSTFLSPYDSDMTRFFLVSAVQANLKTHVAHKLAASPHLISRCFWQRPLLDRALRPSPWTKPTYRIDPNMIDLLLTRGANPNMTLTLYKGMSKSRLLYTSEKAWTTIWGLFLQSLHDAARAQIRKPPELIQDEIEATKLMIEHGAAADLRPWRILASEDSWKHFGSPMLTPSDIFHDVFPPRDAVFLEQLSKKHRASTLRQACSWVRMTVLLWFYRNIDILWWSLTHLIYFVNKVGVILSIVFILTSLYGLPLVWPATWFTFSGAAPILLPTLILSDWIPILDWLVSCLTGVIARHHYTLVITRDALRILYPGIGRSVEEAFEGPEEPTPDPIPTMSRQVSTQPIAPHTTTAAFRKAIMDWKTANKAILDRMAAMNKPLDAAQSLIREPLQQLKHSILMNEEDVQPLVAAQSLIRESLQQLKHSTPMNEEDVQPLVAAQSLIRQSLQQLKHSTSMNEVVVEPLVAAEFLLGQSGQQLQHSTPPTPQEAQNEEEKQPLQYALLKEDAESTAKK